MKMKFILPVSLGVLGKSSAFAPIGTPLHTSNAGVPPAASPRSSTALNVLVSEYATREVDAMETWTMEYGAQKAEGIELYTADGGKDYQLITQSFVPAGTTLLYVPSHLVLSSDGVLQEYGEWLSPAEQELVRSDSGTAKRLPLFRLMVKILAEYEKGRESPYFPYMDSLPRKFYNGVSMTDACFDCLPPYARMLTMNERNTYSRFLNALRGVEYTPLKEDTIYNARIVKWAYNVALTRFHETWQPSRQKLLIPMVDMLNHSAEPNCEITVDQGGDVYVSALSDIPAGSPLTTSLGDPTNPTPIFAKYGFLASDSSAVFCKAIHLESQITELGYDYKDLVFYTEGGVAPKVWDIFLYELLQNNDPGAANEFFIACKVNDENVKEQYHNYYFQYTLDALKQHVSGILGDVTSLTMKAQNYDLQTHPRVPVIVAHNNFVWDTFSMTASLLEQMG